MYDWSGDWPLQCVQLPCIDRPACVETNIFQQPPVVGHQQQRSLVAVQRLLQLFNGYEVKMVGGFVQHQHVDAARLQQGQDARVRSPGESAPMVLVT